VTRLAHALRSPAAGVVGVLLGAGLLALLVVRLRHLWDEHPVPLDEANGLLLALGLAVSGAAMTAYGAVWATTLRAVGATAPVGLLGLFYTGQLAKYLPGSAWQYLGRAALAMRAGVPLRLGAVSLVLEAGCSLLAAVLIAPFVLATDGPRAAVVAAAVLALALTAGLVGRSPWARQTLRRLLERTAGVEARVDLRAVRGATVLYAGVWLVFGLALWLIAAALYAEPLSDFLLYTGAFAAAWATGFVVVFAPGGIGVREAVLVLLLRGRLGESEAIVLAAASRIALTLVDVAGGAAALALLRRAPKTPG
jgi:glycosyltransferase 2 family protein